MRRFMICGVLAIAALAAATVVITDNAAGGGRAVNGDGHGGEFHFGATKVSHNEDSQTRGTFTFSMQTGDGSVRVLLPAVQRMGVNENVAELFGDGSVRIQTRNGAHEYRGTVDVTATSNRHPGEAGDPDGIAVDFVPAVQGNPDFHFTGHVVAGDIAVATTRSY